MEDSQTGGTALATGQFKVGPLFINLRVLLEALGFLRIVMVVLAILTFALTSGYNPSASRNTIQCNNASLSIAASYPYDGASFTYTSNVTNTTCRFENKPFSGSAQYFVGMGVLTFLYLLLIVAAYIFLVNPMFPFANYILIADLFASFLFGFFYLLADIAWAVGIAQLGTYISSTLTSCLNCPSVSPNVQTPLAAIASVIFGWLMAFLWFASIWFIYRDGPFYGKIGLDSLKAKLRGGSAAPQNSSEPQQP